MRGSTALALAFVALAAPSSGQQAAPPVATPVDLLAFTDAGLRMTVPVSIAGAGPYGFIIDTGAQRTVISRELAETLGLEPGRNVRLTAMEGTSEVHTVVIPSISVGPFGGNRIEAPALAAQNLGAIGILGIDTLQGHAVTIDFDRQQMTVTPSVKRRTPPPARDEIVVHARNLLGQLVVTDAYFNNHRVRVILDTGSVVTMGNLAFRRQVVRSAEALETITLLSVTGGRLSADYTQVGRVTIGGIAIGNLPVAFADAAPFQRFGLAERPALLLGMDTLKLFRRVEIDFANREVRLLLPRDTMRSGCCTQ